MAIGGDRGPLLAMLAMHAAMLLAGSAYDEYM
jgi:hypothetical protein